MGQSCMTKNIILIEDNTQIQSKNKYSLPNKPKWELSYITGREQTLEDMNELDIGTNKSKKKEVRFMQSLNSSAFLIGVNEQKKQMKQQMKLNKDSISFLFEKKDYKLIVSDREQRKQKYSERINHFKENQARQNSYSSNTNSMDLSNSPLQKSLRYYNKTQEIFKAEVKSLRSLTIKQMQIQQQQQGILKHKSKKKAKSLYGRRNVHFQC